MNYIQEELLRQRQALAALMSGKQPEPEAEQAAPEAAAQEQPDAWWEQAAETAGPSRRSAAGAAAEQILPADRRWPVFSGVGGAVRAAAEQGDGTVRRNVPVWLTADAPRRETGGVELRAVSRGFQRDARRYDGGFSMY